MDPMIAEAVRRLELFNAKATKLNGSRFLAAARSGRQGYRIAGKLGVGYELESHLPDDEDIESYVLTLRLFLQRLDRIDLKSIATTYESLPVSSTLQTRAGGIAKSVELYLDAQSPIIIDQQRLSRRTVWETILYGGLAHANPDKHPTYVTWTADELKRVVTHDQFVDIALVITQAIFDMRHVNIDALVELRKEIEVAPP